MDITWDHDWYQEKPWKIRKKMKKKCSKSVYCNLHHCNFHAITYRYFEFRKWTWKEVYSVGRNGWSKSEIISLSMHARWTCTIINHFFDLTLGDIQEKMHIMLLPQFGFKKHKWSCQLSKFRILNFLGT